MLYVLGIGWCGGKGVQAQNQEWRPVLWHSMGSSNLLFLENAEAPWLALAMIWPDLYCTPRANTESGSCGFCPVALTTSVITLDCQLVAMAISNIM